MMTGLNFFSNKIGLKCTLKTFFEPKLDKSNSRTIRKKNHVKTLSSSWSCDLFAISA